jgi:hypothetical protein
MLETLANKKTKITLADYDYRGDIENRLIMAQFSAFDVSVLEEILYSSLTISVKQLAETLESKPEKLLPILKKLSKTGLLKVGGDQILVDKEMRKYFEVQILKFHEEFRPGMEYLQGLLRKVPIHVLPIWYSIPRTSNNIFDSLIEKYLLTPQTFQRYLNELQVSDPTLFAIMEDLHNAPDMKISSEELMEKHQLLREEFEEVMLQLEFSLVGVLSYEKVGGKWHEIVTPYHEWRDYLTFLRTSEAPSITEGPHIERTRPDDFAFVQDMTQLLSLIKKQPLAVSEKQGSPLPAKSHYAAICAKCKGLKEDSPDFLPYLKQLIAKLTLLRLVDLKEGKLRVTDAAQEWQEMSVEERALHLYRHPLNQIVSVSLPPTLANERHIRDAEKSITRVVQSGWVYFDEFMKGVHIPLSSESTVSLKRAGKQWKYQLPTYSADEQALIKATIFEWLFETGIVATGKHRGKECFRVTPFGQSLFGN